MGGANPATLVTTGHTHRHRRRRHGPVVVTEVGSVKDHPGTWAGYLVYEGGIVQTVRRIMDPTALAWTERTRDLGLRRMGPLVPRPPARPLLHPCLARLSEGVARQGRTAPPRSGKTLPTLESR